MKQLAVIAFLCCLVPLIGKTEILSKRDALACKRLASELDDEKSRLQSTENRLQNRLSYLENRADTLRAMKFNLDSSRSLVENCYYNCNQHRYQYRLLRNKFQRQVRQFERKESAHNRQNREFRQAVKRYKYREARFSDQCAGKKIKTSVLKEMCAGSSNRFCDFAK